MDQSSDLDLLRRFSRGGDGKALEMLPARHARMVREASLRCREPSGRRSLYEEEKRRLLKPEPQGEGCLSPEGSASRPEEHFPPNFPLKRQGPNGTDKPQHM